MGKQYCVYILTNYTNSVLYTGITSNLPQRIYQHKSKLIRGFTAKYSVWKLVYYEMYNEPLLAIQREKQIKNLLRRKKEALIRTMNPGFKELQI
ncbi:MAG: GIY-YIG nuclease family protein [Candidatus Cloacimonetes bacterium]|nr:GIY-YIG nuclease family protein [Candidatus Cloacimonadota bacterium]